MFKGKKTYILGGVSILGAIASYLVGDITVIDAAQVVVPAVLGMTVRNAIPKQNGIY
jgi:hypothetical protein